MAKYNQDRNDLEVGKSYCFPHVHRGKGGPNRAAKELEKYEARFGLIQAGLATYCWAFDQPVTFQSTLDHAFGVGPLFSERRVKAVKSIVYWVYQAVALVSVFLVVVFSNYTLSLSVARFFLA